MNEVKHDGEIALVKKIAGNFLRHPLQVNGIYESDSEIIDIKGWQFPYLVAKTDCIHEEIRTGLYTDPFLIGWMAVTVTMSDFAATGAEPLGLLLSLQVPRQFDDCWMQEFQRGINEACWAYNTHILGGDTNFSQQVSVVTTGIGSVDQPMMRKGIHEGDLLYATGPLGLGNSFAYSVFFDHNIQTVYKPVARLKESKCIKQFATACIDTSDGLFPALSVLAEINGTGLHFSQPLEDILCTEAKLAYTKGHIPSWFFLAGPHGEYELLFTIPPSHQREFEKACSAAGWQSVFLGTTTNDHRVHFTSGEISVSCHPAEIANLFDEAGNDIQNYFHLLLKKHKHFCATKTLIPC